MLLDDDDDDDDDGGNEEDDNDTKDDGVGVGVSVSVGVGVGVGVGVADDGDGDGDGELLGDWDGAGELEAGALGEEAGSGIGSDSLSESLVPPSKTTKLAFDPSGTVTTQKLAPPTPSLPPPSTSLTWCLLGSIAHGRPLQSPSQTISTPQVGILSRNGVAGSR